MLMISDGDIAEFYEWLERKRQEADQESEAENLIEQQMHHIRELIRIQQKILGIKA